MSDAEAPSLSQRLLPGVPLVESPLFAASLEAMGLSDWERAAATALNENGFAVIDFPDPDIAVRIERIKAALSPRFAIDMNDPAAIKNEGDHRIQDAWMFDDDVKAIATNPAILALLARLYGRRAIPFQTLSFPVGTQQHLHSDAVHFSSQPERFMCGVWLAMEDIQPGAGPLEYCPGSHKWPILGNALIGRSDFADRSGSAQAPYEAVWRAMVEASGNRRESFMARKGQALIWAANLLHGGGLQSDPTLTRWSQVTHYYFADCIYYTPAFSLEPRGQLDLRTITNIASGARECHRLNGEQLPEIAPTPTRSPAYKRTLSRLTERFWPRTDAPTELPGDFDDATYLRLNPDVALAGCEGAAHYLRHGKAEGRFYRIG